MLLFILLSLELFNLQSHPNLFLIKIALYWHLIIALKQIFKKLRNFLDIAVDSLSVSRKLAVEISPIFQHFLKNRT